MYHAFELIFHNREKIFFFQNIFFSILIIWLCYRYGDYKQLFVKLLLYGSFLSIVNTVLYNIFQFRTFDNPEGIIQQTNSKMFLYYNYAKIGLSSMAGNFTSFGLILLLQHIFFKNIKENTNKPFTVTLTKMLILSIFTLGLYNVYWILSRIMIFPKLQKTSILNTLIFLILLFAIIHFFVLIGLFDLTVGKKEPHFNWVLTGLSVANLLFAIVYLKLLFYFRNFLFDIEKRHYKDIVRSNLLTLLFQIFYLQYLIDKKCHD